MKTITWQAKKFNFRWGIGLGKANPRAVVPAQWRGKNWLGQCLVVARQAIEDGEEISLPQLPYPISSEQKLDLLARQ